MGNCPHRVEWFNDHLQSNAFRCEPILPEKERCMLRQPDRFKRFDPGGILWLGSGGSALHFKECDSNHKDKCKRRKDHALSEV